MAARADVSRLEVQKLSRSKHILAASRGTEIPLANLIDQYAQPPAAHHWPSISSHLISIHLPPCFRTSLLLAAMTETSPDDGWGARPQQRGTQRRTKPSAAAWHDGTQPCLAIELAENRTIGKARRQNHRAGRRHVTARSRR